MSKFWSGKYISTLEPNQIFVFGSNPEGRHGAGAAKSALKFGAKYGVGRGIQGNTYALPTKNLKENFYEKSTGILYKSKGYRSLSVEQIVENIIDLYDYAIQNPDKEFIITYQYNTNYDGSPIYSLNGYSTYEIMNMFLLSNPPDNIVFHSSYKEFKEKYDNQITISDKQ